MSGDAHIDALRDMGVTEYDIDDLWTTASDLKATYSPAIGDAYAVAAATDLDIDDRNATLLDDGRAVRSISVTARGW